MKRLNNKEIFKQFEANGKTLVVEISSECNKSSGEVVATLNDEEKQELFKLMRTGFKDSETGDLNIESTPVTRRVFAGYIKETY